jgi:hypothetical protein
MFERLRFALQIFFRILNEPGLVRRLKKLLARNVEAIDAKVRAEEKAQALRDGALRALAVLQKEGRLIDFVQEDIAGFSDDQVGSAARNIHTGCRKALEKLIALERVRTDAKEMESVTVPEGFDPSAVRLTGNVGGKPPFRGTLVHQGWRAKSITLPDIAGGQDVAVLAPAEVEVA